MTAEVESASSMHPEVPAIALLDADDESSCGNHSEGADSDPKDSGVESGSSDPYISPDVPDEETAAMIVRTVEFYLSDENILKDPFLLKHVRRNKEGFVSLKLLASFRRVRCLSRNWKAVAHSVKKSEKLSLNLDGTKVRRLDPLPDYDETVGSRSIVVHGFGVDKPSVDGVGEMFAQCGDIALVRILRPGGTVPSDVKKFLSRNPELQCKVCALVEFEEHAATRKSLESDLPEGIQVVPILVKDKGRPESPKKQLDSPDSSPKKKKKNRKMSNADKKSQESGDSTDGDLKRTRRSSSGSVSSQSSGYLSSSPCNGNLLDSRYPRRHSFNPSIYGDPNSSFASLGSRHQGSRERLHKEAVLNPWRRRKEQMMKSDSNLLTAVSSVNSQPHGQPVKTVRAPRGPDGTNGFSTRSRPSLPSTAE